MSRMTFWPMDGAFKAQKERPGATKAPPFWGIEVRDEN